MSLLSGIVLALLPGVVVRDHGEGVKPNPLREENERLKQEIADLKERLSVAEGVNAMRSREVDRWRDEATAAQRALADRFDERLSEAAATLIESGRLPYREPSDALVELLNQHPAAQQNFVFNPLTEAQHQVQYHQNNQYHQAMRSHFASLEPCTCVPGRSALLRRPAG